MELSSVAFGNFGGKDLSHPELRQQFEREHVINTGWYKNRLLLKQPQTIFFSLNFIPHYYFVLL